MNPQEPAVPNDSLSATAIDEPAAEAPAVKPRRTRARKAVAAEAEPALPEAASADAPSSASSESVSDQADGTAAEASVAKPRTRRRKAVVEAAVVEPVAPVVEPAMAETVAAMPAEAQPAPEAAVQVPVAVSEEAGLAPEGASDIDEDDEDDEDEDAKAEQAERPEPMDVGEVFAQVLSGEFDAEGPEATAAVPAKRVLLPDPDAPKLHKVLAQAGIGSRRDMEQMIVDGLITVNGQPAHTGQRISFGDQIKVDGKPVRVSIVPPPPRIIAYHKPAGEVVTHDDPQHRPTVFRRLPRLPKGKWQSVGRLDLNTEGLLLFTNSGELANQLMHPRFGVEREYAVRVLGTLEPEAKAKLLEGVEIEGQPASFKSVEEGGGDGANRWYRVVITEGRNREVRKLFDAVGLTVNRLIRIRYGSVVLPRGLKRGVWVNLLPDEVQLIRQLAGGGAPRKAQGRGNNNNNRRNKQQRGNDGPRRNSNGNHGNNNTQQERFNDRMAQRQQNAAVRQGDDFEDDFDPRHIPNPLEQTFDKRFVQNPRSPTGGRGFRHGGGGFGSGGSGPAPVPASKKGGPREPDPLQTSVGYIGADAFHRKGRGGGGRSGGQRGGGGGGGGYGGKRGR